jgi:hypothetical protein
MTSVITKKIRQYFSFNEKNSRKISEKEKRVSVPRCSPKVIAMRSGTEKY